MKIVGVATSCSLQIEGSGFVISPGHVLTNAHVVAGVKQGLYVYATNSKSYNARVVLFDPMRDIAVLDVPGLTARPLRFRRLGRRRRERDRGRISARPRVHPTGAAGRPQL